MISKQILTALSKGAPFLTNLPESTLFDRSTLTLSSETSHLNLEQKLGHLYEDGLKVLLDGTERYEVFESGLQLNDAEKQTIGELDFLFRDHCTGKLIHLELAVKFYLAIQNDNELLLPGPNSKDNYYNKLDRLRSHQLTLASRFKHLLPEPYRLETIETRHLVIGCLFDHLDSQKPSSPPFLHPEARRGVWLHQSEFASHFPKIVSPLVIPKPLWPVELDLIKDRQLSPLDLSQPLPKCTLVKVAEFKKPVFIAPDEPHWP